MSAPTNDAPSRSVLLGLLIRSWEYRHPDAWVRVRVACSVFNLGLGVLLLASSQWLGSLALLGLIPLAGAALIFWTAYRLHASVHD
jgi:hypothetical protein